MGYKLIIRKGEYLKVNPDIRSVYKNLPWNWVLHKQKKISKKQKRNIDFSGYIDLREKRLNEKARTVFKVLYKKFGELKIDEFSRF